MTKLMKVFSLAVMISITPTQAASAAGMFSVFGAGVLPQTINGGIDPTTGASSEIVGKLGFGGGVLGELMLSSRVGLEAGGVYLNRKYGETLDGVDSGATFASKSVYIPVGLRFHANRVISLQAGGFYDHSLETGDEANYGFQGGLRLSMPVSGSTAFFVEGRYDLGLKDFSGGKVGDIALVMLGLTFGGMMR